MPILCPHCGADTLKLLTARDINQKISEQEFTYHRCIMCKFIFLNPIPENIQDYYGQAYHAYQQLDEIAREATEYDTGKVTLVKKYASGKKLLEIGPANGTFAYLIKQEGFIVDAIEMDPNCCNFLKEKLKLRNVINSNNIAESLEQTEGAYDVIVMWHVLEHLKDPWSVLRALPKALSQNGIIIIAVPNPEALQFRLFKQYWKHLDAPRHVAFLPKNLLMDAMNMSGLEKVLVTSNDEVSAFFNSYPWWLHTLENFRIGSKNSLLSRVLQRTQIGRIIYYGVIKRFEGIEGKGNAYISIYRNTKHVHEPSGSGF